MLAAHLRDIRNIGTAIHQAQNALAVMSSLIKGAERKSLLAQAQDNLRQAEELTHNLHLRANEQMLNLAEELSELLPVYGKKD